MKRERCFGGVVVSVLAMTMPILGACCGTTEGTPRPRGLYPGVVKVEPVHNQQEFLAAVRALALELEWGDYELSSPRFRDGEWRVIVWFLPRRPGGLLFVYISPDGSVTFGGGV